MPVSGLPKILVVVGPTASGKSDVAIALAKKFGGEIVSADSRQLYKGMEIGAAIEPGKRQKVGGRQVLVAHGVAHHLMAALPPEQHITVAEWKKMAEEVIDDILSRGKVPIVAGGTGLYVKALVENFTIPEVPPDAAMRASLEKKSTKALFAILKRKDAAYAARITPQNRRYIVRALEVMQATGRKFSEAQSVGVRKYDALIIGVSRPRNELYKRIDARVDAMARAGLVREARRLVKKYGWDAPAMTAIGYRQLKDFLGGKESLAAALDRLKRDTRRYAKRQLTWGRREKGIRWAKNGAQALRLAMAFLRRGSRKPRRRAA